MNQKFLMHSVKILLANSIKTCVQRRFYRHGRRVSVNGFYVSPAWFDQELLKQQNNNQTSNTVLRSSGIVKQANKAFDEEKQRQKLAVSRIEKIEVHLEKPFPKGEDYILMMNRNISTPFDCAAHINEILKERSALAVIDGTEYWHMHQPLQNSCTLRLLHYKHSDTIPVNLAFWRSCSLLLANVIKKVFRDEFKVQIISQPMSDLSGGSFICDVSIANLKEWQPSSEEIRSITALLWEESNKGHLFERLEVNADLASQLVADNVHRLALIESEVSQGKQEPFVVYRVGDHIDLCRQPMVASTKQIGSIYLCAIHPLTSSNGSKFYRFQGVAMPKQLHINSYAYTLIRDRARTLNRTGLQK